jgi:Raf kinase inhibitor-like YbhB/YbcL family protein
MKFNPKIFLTGVLALTCAVLLVAQPPAGKGGPGGAPGKGGGGKGGGKGFGGGPALSVTSSSFADGAEVPVKHSFYGENKLPEFTFNWSQAGNPVAAPATLQTYAVIFHDAENATAKGPEDTLHWSAFNIPGTAKGLPEGMGGGDLPDGTRNGPGIGAGRGAPAYFGPGAGPGPHHHYIWEFYALDTKLDLPANTTRAEILKAMEGHVVGKAVYVGRFRNQPAQ